MESKETAFKKDGMTWVKEMRLQYMSSINHNTASERTGS